MTTTTTEKPASRTYSPGINYEGDRPNLYWPAFLYRLEPVLEYPPRLRRTVRPSR